ncbi:MAG: hypothetical protein ATN31_10910 [Candidatus Epulonipiscioides saccharophilum]|nr:MAG: hypothetical protein ATN31_10910 [Epulopiscium sp. AS2M-Bin001]
MFHIKYIINASLLIIILFFIYLSGIRFFIPSLPEINIISTPHSTNPQLITNKITFTAHRDPFYILITPSNPWANIIFYNTQNIQLPAITQRFLPSEVNEYCILPIKKGETHAKFDVFLETKISIIDLNNYQFNIQVIVPEKFLFFPTFYFNHFYVYDIEPQF